MYFKKLIVLLVYICSFNTLKAQNAFWSLDPMLNHKIDRLETKSGKFFRFNHTTNKPIARENLSLSLSVLKLDSSASKIDSLNYKFLKDDLWENDFLTKSSKGVFKYFYKHGHDAFSVSKPDFTLQISPVLWGKVGSNSAFGKYSPKTIITNTRGIEIKGNLLRKLGFYSFLTENLIDSPHFISNYYNSGQEAYPYEGLVKVVDNDSKKLSVDFFSAQAYLRFTPIKNLGLSFGHDRNFIGNGIRSLALSDFSVPFLNFKADFTLGNFQFLNLIGQMTNSQGGRPANSEFTYPPKFIVLHNLSINLTKKLNIGVFEQILFGKREAGFELNYLNPIIFYRFVEGNIGSSDNAIVGANFKLILGKSFSTYGQFILDEYNNKEYKKDNSWQKKFGHQIGVKYFDVLGVNNLDLQLERNMVRPFTYSHFTPFTNAVNYNVPLAHPLGANFKELLTIIKYQPFPKVYLQISQMRALKGEDQNNLNYGGDLLLPYSKIRANDYGNVVGQGFKNNIINTEVWFSYRIFANIYAEATAQFRKDSFVIDQTEKIIQVGIRWNHPYRQHLY